LVGGGAIGAVQNTGKQSDTTERGNALMLLYEQMVLLRLVEERLCRLFADGHVPGFIHVAIGQEAIPVGLSACLDASDTIASTHRGHGHALAKGLSLDGFFAELMGRDTGLCRGRGGSMHVAEMGVGMLGANGIVGAGIPIALGSALAHRQLRPGAVAVAYFGDGAMAEGVLHESLNIAAISGAPILFACENNGWSEFSPTSTQVGFKLEDLAHAHGLAYAKSDGNDVEAVAKMAARLVGEIRRTSKPAVLECLTTRVRGHFEGDPQRYREDPHDGSNDPIEMAKARLADAGVADQVLDDLRVRVADRIEAAIAKALEAPFAGWDAAVNDVFRRQVGVHA
jgi:acetoin:2,6-dichlorophenolindophenol oxidoreductase subunit alpha